MLMIVCFHANYVSLGAPTRADVLASPLTSFGRILAEQICVVGVNVFVLISGWFGIKASVKGLCSLLFQVLFWGIVVVALGWVFHLNIPLAKTAKVLWFGSYYWFIIAYIGLYVLSPMLNLFIDKATKKQFLTVIICFFLTEFIYGWAVFSESFNRGYSILSFVGLYLLARFIRLNGTGLQATRQGPCLLLYGVLTLIPAIISYIGIRDGWKPLHTLDYSSPFVIGAALSLLIAFSRKEFYSRAVNWVASGVFSVYIIHEHAVIIPYFKSFMRDLFIRLGPWVYAGIVLLLAVAFILACALFNRLRVVAWKWCCSRFFDRGFVALEERYNRLIEKI